MSENVVELDLPSTQRPVANPFPPLCDCLEHILEIGLQIGCALRRSCEPEFDVVICLFSQSNMRGDAC